MNNTIYFFMPFNALLNNSTISSNYIENEAILKGFLNTDKRIYYWKKLESQLCKENKICEIFLSIYNSYNDIIKICNSLNNCLLCLHNRNVDNYTELQIIISNKIGECCELYKSYADRNESNLPNELPSFHLNMSQLLSDLYDGLSPLYSMIYQIGNIVKHHTSRIPINIDNNKCYIISTVLKKDLNHKFKIMINDSKTLSNNRFTVSHMINLIKYISSVQLKYIGKCVFNNKKFIHQLNTNLKIIGIPYKLKSVRDKYKIISQFPVFFNRLKMIFPILDKLNIIKSLSSRHKIIQPKLRFKGFYDEWNLKKLSDIFNKITNAYVGTVKKYYTNSLKGHFYLESNNIKNGKININKQVFVNDKFYRSQKKNWLHTDNIVMVQSGAVGDTAVIPENLNNTAAHAVIVISTPKVPTNSYFLNDEFQSQYFKKEIYKLAVGNTVSHVLASDVKKSLIKIPSLSEQHRIGIFFVTLDRLIQLQQKKVTLLKRLKKAYLQKLFPRKNETIPRIRFKGFHGKWKINILGELGDTFTSLTGKNKKDFGHGKAEYIPYMNVHDNPIALRNYTGKTEIDNKQNQVKKGDIFFTTSSETPEEVGFSSVWIYNTKNVYLNSFSFGYRLKYPFNSYYMGYALRAPLMRSKIYPLAQGISRYNMSKCNLMKVTFEYPSLKEQYMIGYLFRYIDSIISLQSNNLNYLCRLKRAYLQKMFC